MNKVKVLLLAALVLIASSVVVFAREETERGYNLEIYASGELFHTMEVIPQSPGRFIFSFSIYRVPKGQSPQTAEGERIYAFQIVPHLEGDLVKVEVLALVEDPNTVSEAHPLHKFKKQVVGSYSVRAGESIAVSEMSRLGVKPLELKVVSRS